MWGKDTRQFVRCDGCGSFADKLRLEGEPSKPGLAESLGAAPLLSGPSFESIFGHAPPTPVTRLERLVVALLQDAGPMRGDLSDDTQSWILRDARTLVYFARCVERELDAPPLSEPQKPEWLSLRFQDRNAYKTWLMSMLDEALHKVDPEPMRVDLHPFSRHQWVAALAEGAAWLMETESTFTAGAG